MRLIDADAVLERIGLDCDARCLYKDYKEPLRSKMCNCCDLGGARMYVEDAPTVDAEPIIRCKDCKYWNKHHFVDIYVCSIHNKEGQYPYLLFEMNADDFCSRGVRR